MSLNVARFPFRLFIAIDTPFNGYHTCRVLHDVMIEIRFVYVYHEVGEEEHGTRE